LVRIEKLIFFSYFY